MIRSSSMRRTIALSLLLFFGSALMSPFFGPDAEAGLPACCRRHGKHHCTMLQSSGSPSVSEKCPYTPRDGASVHRVSWQQHTERQLHAGVASLPPHLPQTRVYSQLCLLRSHPRRGPPAHFDVSELRNF